jgi:hypothetical protein
MTLERDGTKDLVYYYSDWIWPSEASDWMKAFLLFFDGIALALPSDLATRVVEQDPVLAQPLMDRGLLINLEPESKLDQVSAERLARTLVQLLYYGDGFWSYGDSMSFEERLDFLTSAHWGAAGAPDAADTFFEELRRRGLAEAGLGHVVHMDVGVRLLVLMVFAKVLEACVRQSDGITLQPVTDQPLLASQLLSALLGYMPKRHLHPYHTPHRSSVWYDLQPSSRAAAIVDIDLGNVGVDLSLVPLDEVLAFRDEQGHHYRAYARSLRQFLVDSLHLPQSEYEAALRDREEQIVDEAADLERRSRRAFGRRTAVTTLSLAGAAWTAAHGDPIGALLAAAAAVAGLQQDEPTVTAYSYLFEIRDL